MRAQGSDTEWHKLQSYILVRGPMQEYPALSLLQIDPLTMHVRIIGSKNEFQYLLVCTRPS